MYLECRQYLIDLLKSSGIKSKVCTSQKRLKLSTESHVGAVLMEEEELQKDGSKRIYVSEDGKKKRRKTLERNIIFLVVIGDYCMENVQAIYDKLLVNVADGIYVDGNYVKIDPELAEWLDDEDTIIKAKCAVQLKVRCSGGVYKDTGFKKIEQVNIRTEGEVDGEGRDGKGENTM